ncbi:NUDIX hydrolase [Epibacterium ulvae]|uniref:NUDIX hydrolase n=1 Tax=Epibacterium ulvae TaxID=1156985 RepID=UPI001BFCD1A3|nr:NUDIX hydrolase [Epibacterium ulvae]MBT8155975.1 NUDIX hydrolase [Epibacterium ulvae]
MTATPVQVDKTAIRNASSVIVLRDKDSASPSVLMGQRGAKAAFMPSKFVFPGGAVDPDDASVPLAAPISPHVADFLTDHAPEHLRDALVCAAIRELWEETGLALGQSAVWNDPPADWAAFATTGHRPDASALEFVFRAITPVGRPRRFDARFFLVDAAQITSDLDDFTHASDELSNLQWVPLSHARSFDLPFITQVVLAEVAARLPNLAPITSVPFFQNNDEESLFLHLNGASPLG